ncbi:MAG: protein translocase subunit SecF, partial [Spirochaetales bacterium]
RSALSGLSNPQIQSVGNPANQEYAIKVKQVGDSKTFSGEMENTIQNALSTRFGAQKVEILQTEYVGPRFSADLASQAAFLTVFALFLIMLYSWFRFRLAYALAAIAATVHDPLIMIALIGATQMEVTTATVAAVLTIIGYSINDTIVVFDRIRENTRLMREHPFDTIINVSITQSLSRTLITSLTTIIAIFAVYIFGSGEVQLFSMNVIIGVVVGTYSSIFIASPVLLELKKLGDRIKERKEKGKGTVIKTGVRESKPSNTKELETKEVALTTVKADTLSKEEEPVSVPTSSSPGIDREPLPSEQKGKNEQGSGRPHLPARLSREKRKRKGKR